jgi:hypothetical protein
MYARTGDHPAAAGGRPRSLPFGRVVGDRSVYPARGPVLSDLGEPTQPFTVLEGSVPHGGWVDAELLLKLKA